jgi:hypothetical protein
VRTYSVGCPAAEEFRTKMTNACSINIVFIYVVKNVEHSYYEVLSTVNNIYIYTFLFIYLFIFTIYSRYLKRVISKRDGCVYLKQVPSSDGSLELIQ